MSPHRFSSAFPEVLNLRVLLQPVHRVRRRRKAESLAGLLRCPLRVQQATSPIHQALVRCTQQTGHPSVRHACQQRAMCGRLRIGKDFLHAYSIGRSSHVFGLRVRHAWPLAIMPSADQVPVKNSHSTMRWPEWVVLIARSTGSALRAVCPFQSSHHVRCPTRSLHTLSAAGCL